MRTLLVVAALLLAGCASTGPDEERWWPESCRDDFTPATDTQPGVATVPVPVRLHNALTGQPVQSEVSVWGGPDLPPSFVVRDHACTLAAARTGTDGRAVLNVAPGTWHVLEASLDNKWTPEAAPNTTIREGMAEVVVPVWPQEATLGFNGTLTGLDPQGDTETEAAAFQLFGDLSPELQAASIQRLRSGDSFSLLDFRLTWTNEPTRFADLGVRFYYGTTFGGYLDEQKGTDLGPQSESFEALGYVPGYNKTSALRDGFFVRVSDPGPMVAPQGIPFSASFRVLFWNAD
ncbi:MAG: hypothetical protein QOD77_2180 [Thermoplasmata archaeon]|jgi:hypothetical protein|nr:hypothetical protein [Thermoplasmata archaeon]